MKIGVLKWVFLAAAGSILTAIAVLGVLWWGFESRFHESPKPASFPTPQSRAESQRQDLEYLAQLMRLDHSFSPTAQAAFEHERGDLVARAGSLSDGQLEMAVSHAVAFAGNGHTLVGRRSRRMARLPVRVAWFDEGLYVIRATDANAGLLGSRVLRINGMTPETMLPLLAPYLSGTADGAKASSSLLFELPAALAAVWPEMDMRREKLSLQAADGQIRDVELAAVAPDPKATPLALERNVYPKRSPDEPDGWRAFLQDGPQLPLSLQDPDASVLSRALDNGKGLYLAIHQIDDDSKGSLSGQLEDALRDIGSGALRYAILDLRYDGGGNYMKTLGFTKALPKRVAADGKLLILTNNATFSAAIVTLARAKYFAGSRALIVGEHVGDREQFWAESSAPLVLPNSKIHIFFATGYHDWAVGCGDFNRCFWPNVLLDVPAGSLAPNVTAAWRFSDYAAGRDTVFERALQIARADSAGARGGHETGAPRPAL